MPPALDYRGRLRHGEPWAESWFAMVSAPWKPVTGAPMTSRGSTSERHGRSLGTGDGLGRGFGIGLGAPWGGTGMELGLGLGRAWSQGAPACDGIPCPWEPREARGPQPPEAVKSTGSHIRL